MKQRWMASYLLGLIAVMAVVLLLIPTSRATGPLTGVKVCLDPGHGGSDPGAVNAEYDLTESEINLDVSWALGDLLALDGATVVMTRTGDEYKDNRDRYTFCNEQQADLLVSVHTNSTVEPAFDGALVLYFQSDDKILAQAIYDVMYPSLLATAPDPESFLGFGLDRFASGVLLKSDMPAAMTEPLFMSNPAEAALLTQRIADGCGDLSCRRGQIARAIHEGVLNYVGGAEPTPTPEPGGTLHVAAIDLWSVQKGPKYSVYTRVTIQDESWQPAAGATVSVSIILPDGSRASYADNTGDDGTVTFKLRSSQSGIYRSEVAEVQKAGWEYSADANVETVEEVTVP
jgi:N-acetylmuramoyl-L-alanine amidase